MQGSAHVRSSTMYENAACTAVQLDVEPSVSPHTRHTGPTVFTQKGDALSLLLPAEVELSVSPLPTDNTQN